MWMQHRPARIPCQADGTEFRNVPFFLFWFFDLLWSTVEAAQENPGIAPMIFPKRPYKISAAMIFSAIYVFRCSFVAGSLQRVDDSTWPE